MRMMAPFMGSGADPTSSAPEKRVTIVERKKPATLDMLLGESDDGSGGEQGDEDIIDMRLRAKSMPALKRASIKAEDKLSRKSLVQMRRQMNGEEGEDAVSRSITKADLHEKWSEKPVEGARQSELHNALSYPHTHYLSSPRVHTPDALPACACVYLCVVAC